MAPKKRLEDEDEDESDDEYDEDCDDDDDDDDGDSFALSAEEKAALTGSPLKKESNLKEKAENSKGATSVPEVRVEESLSVAKKSESTDKVNKSTENKEYLDKVSQKHETVDTEKDKVLLRSADTKEAALEALLKSNSRPSSRLMVAVDFDADKVDAAELRKMLEEERTKRNPDSGASSEKVSDYKDTDLFKKLHATMTVTEEEKKNQEKERKKKEAEAEAEREKERKRMEELRKKQAEEEMAAMEEAEKAKAEAEKKKKKGFLKLISPRAKKEEKEKATSPRGKKDEKPSSPRGKKDDKGEKSPR